MTPETLDEDGVRAWLQASFLPAIQALPPDASAEEKWALARREFVPLIRAIEPGTSQSRKLLETIDEYAAFTWPDDAAAADYAAFELLVLAVVLTDEAAADFVGAAPRCVS